MSTHKVDHDYHDLPKPEDRSDGRPTVRHIPRDGAVGGGGPEQRFRDYDPLLRRLFEVHGDRRYESIEVGDARPRRRL